MVGLLLSTHHGHLQDRLLHAAIDSPFKVLTPMAMPAPLFLQGIEVAPKAEPILQGLYTTKAKDELEQFRRTVLLPHIEKYIRTSVRGGQNVSYNNGKG